MSGERKPHTVQRQRPGKPTTQIAKPQLDQLVDSLREAPPDPLSEPAFELPDAMEEDVIELEMSDDEPAPAVTQKSRLAHTVKRKT